MNVSLISRSFKSHKQGMGIYSKNLFESIQNENNINIKLISQDYSLINNDTPLDYLFFSLIEIPFKLKDADVYHAMSPIESFYLDTNKTVVTIMDLIPIKLPGLLDEGIQSKFLKFFFDKALKKAVKCKEIIAISDETAKDLSNHYNVNHEAIHIIRPIIRDLVHKENVKISKDNVFTVGTVSYLTNRKRIDILIKSFLKADIEDSQLLIGGKGPQLDNLKFLANSDHRVKFLGFIPDDEMGDFYNSLDVFVFPTIMEGYGLPIVEAMAYGKPVITLEDAYIPQDIKKRTFISTKYTLAEDLESKNFSCDIKSNLDFANEHSSEKMVKQLMEIYKSI